MKLIVDENIPFGKEAFENFGEVVLCNGREIDASVCKDADALIVRSITKVDKDLLHSSSVKFVGTTTIGTDHIDQAYLKEQNISFSSAAGCNAYSVAEYVFSALSSLADKYKLNLSELSIGVVGYGNIGKKVVAIADTMGMKVIVNDPPLQRETNERKFSTFEEALRCDIVSFHVPLNRSGIDRTVHLLNEENIHLLKSNAIVINSSRGPVLSNEALKKRLKEKRDIYAVIDVWETEPNYDLQLLELVNIGTPHIAGYSYDGKVNGTTMIYSALSKHAGLNPGWKPELLHVMDKKIEISVSKTEEELLLKVFEKSYNIMHDDALLRQGMNLRQNERDQHFDSLRKNYTIRRELNNFEIVLNLENEKFRNLLKVLRISY